MNGTFLKCLVTLGLASLVGCKEELPNTFKLVGELPPDFAYSAAAYYKPKPGTECSVTDWKRTMPTFNSDWRKEYNPVSIIEIYKVIKGCRMVVSHIKIRIFGVYGKVFNQVTEADANVGIYAELDDKYRRVMNADDGDTFYGKCQWWFRTLGPDRRIRKILNCKKDNERGEKFVGNPFGAYMIDQLPGKTIRMNIRLEGREEPSIDDTWVEFSNGWKRCMGKGLDDLYGFCRGNYKDFVDFKMPDGRICQIYPDCNE